MMLMLPLLGLLMLMLPSTSDGSHPVLSVPTININPLLVGQHHTDFDNTVSLMVAAAKSLGFFHVKNHGLSAELITMHNTALLDFFALPLPSKARCARVQSNSRGWSNTELTKTVIDAKELFDFGDAAAPVGSGSDAAVGTNQWPHGTDPTIPLQYFHACTNLSHTVLNALLRGIGLDPLPPDDAEVCSFVFPAQCFALELVE